MIIWILYLIQNTMLNDIISYNPVTWIFKRIFADERVTGKLASFFSSLFIKNAPYRAQNFLFGVGIGAITYKLGVYLYNAYKFFRWVPAQIQNNMNFKPDAFKQKYGDCYVLITGAADGIGYAYCWQFARMGFKILMADIQQRKLFFRKHELTQTFPNIKVETFVVDMSDLKQIQDFVGKIQRYDIGIVINNVGLTGGGPFLQIDPKLLMKTVVVNYRPMYEINRALIPKLRGRKQRSAIINTASCTGYYISHYVGAYSSSKLMTDIYSRTLSIQNRDKIDVICSRPFGVSTGMLKMRKQQGIITPKQCARGVLMDLGNCDTTFSGMNHKYLGAYFSLLSEAQILNIYEAGWAKNRNHK